MGFLFTSSQGVNDRTHPQLYEIDCNKCIIQNRILIWSDTKFYDYSKWLQITQSFVES